jgi:hypothetical protein
MTLLAAVVSLVGFVFNLNAETGPTDYRGAEGGSHRVSSS